MATSSPAPSSNRSQSNGVLQISTSQTATAGNPSKTTGPKPSAPRLKLIVRRLPPALTEAEFLAVLGGEWKVGQGKVDWFLYKAGKDSKDPSKPSRPSRAYIHLTNESHLLNLSETVRQSIFEDARNTFNSSCLIGPPTVEFAPYGRTPGGRRRVDARAGTIDQDPEFMAFLEGLANPITSKELNIDSVADGTAKQEKVTITPLVQYLKDKKANKSKEAAVKAAKKQESQLAKGKAAKDAHEDTKKRGKDSKADKLVGKATKEAVKILNRAASAKTASASANQKSEGSGQATSTTPKLDLGKVPGRQRGAVLAAHIRMLQRDLGLSPAQAHRQVRRDTADAQKAERAAAAEKASAEPTGSSSQVAQSPTVPTAPKASSSQPQSKRSRAKGPAIPESEGVKGSPSTPSSSAPAPATSTPMVLLKKPESVQSTPTTAPAPQPSKATPGRAPQRPPSTPVPSEGATQAFIKHANPSQGVTETLLKESMEKFGPVSMVEIDKRKGFAYVDFAEPGALKKAMAANPISVAQGTVQVMQRKSTALPPEKKPTHQTPHAPSRGGRGGRGGIAGRRGGRGGGRGGANATQAPASAPTGPAAK